MALYKRKHSSFWWVRFMLDGREVRVSTGTANKKQAIEFESAQRGEAWRQRKLGERLPYPWADAKARWLAETQKRSKRRDVDILAWFDKHLDGQMVQDITREVIEELRALRAKESSKATSDRFMCLLRAILRRCVYDWEVLDRMPKVPMYRAAVPEPRWLTRAQFEALCKHLPKHLELAARFAVLTGLRMRSMTALTWGRIDLKARRMWVPGSHMKAGSAHGVALSHEAVSVMRKLRKLSPEGDDVFQWNGERIDDCNTKAFKDAVKAAKVGPLSWHSLRHTFASWAIQGGVTPYELMHMGAWKSLRMVERYAHLSPDHLTDAIEKVSGRRTLSGTPRKSSREARVSP
jgi:integrase